MVANAVFSPGIPLFEYEHLKISCNLVPDNADSQQRNLGSGKISFWFLELSLEGELRRKMNLWSNYTLLPSQPLSEICFHDFRI